MSKKKVSCKNVVEALGEELQAYHDRKMASLDEVAAAITRLYGSDTPVHLIAAMACAIVHAHTRTVGEAMEKGAAPKEVEASAFGYDVLKETAAYLNENTELSWYVEYISHLIEERPAWVADRDIIE